MRQLPQCEHTFHRRCIDPLLDTKLTCPVCSSVVTDAVKGAVKESQETMPSRTPSWVLVNRPVPLPRTVLQNSSSSSERFEIELNAADSIGSREGESPLLKHVTGSHAEAWNDVDLEKCIDISFTFGTDIPVEKRQQSSHAPDSFSFGISGADFTFAGTETAVDAAAFRSSLRRSRGRESSSSTSSSDFKHSRSTSRSSRSTNSSSDSSFKHMANWDFGHPHLHEVSEHSVTDHLPLTRPPDQTPFDVLPVINGSENHSLRPSKVGSNRNTYSHL